MQPKDLDAAWDQISSLMQQVVDVEYSGHTMETLLNEVLSGNVELWVICRDDVVAVMGVVVSPLGDGMMTMDIVFMVGTEMKKWLNQLLPKFEDYARSQQCELLQFTARKGWAKFLPDYKMTHVMLRKAL